MAIGPILRAMQYNRTRFILIILEIAITLAIVTNCVNMILKERKDLARKSGFDDENLISIASVPFAPEFKEQSYVENIVQADLRAIQSMPGVKAAAATYFLPWQGGGSSGLWRTEGYPDKFQAQIYAGSRGIFDTIGVKVTQGRGFVPNDTPVNPDEPTHVTVISRALARKVWGDKNPIGKVITSGDGDRPRTVIGVIENFYNPYAWNIGEYVLFTPGRAYDTDGSVYLVRTEPGAMKSVASQLEKRLIGVNAGRVFRIRTISELKDQFSSGGRLVIAAMSAVIVVLIFITALGIVGMTAMSVAERTKQIGTRRALGATRRDILTHFLTENWIVTTLGLILGVFATYGLNFLLVSRVSDVKIEWWLVGIGMVLLWVNGLIATIPPALRASMVSPAIATRSV
jgi:putative ABC transport system permease protein